MTGHIVWVYTNLRWVNGPFYTGILHYWYKEGTPVFWL